MNLSPGDSDQTHSNNNDQKSRRAFSLANNSAGAYHAKNDITTFIIIMLGVNISLVSIVLQTHKSQYAMSNKFLT